MHVAAIFFDYSLCCFILLFELFALSVLQVFKERHNILVNLKKKLIIAKMLLKILKCERQPVKKKHLNWSNAFFWRFQPWFVFLFFQILLQAWEESFYIVVPLSPAQLIPSLLVFLIQTRMLVHGVSCNSPSRHRSWKAILLRDWFSRHFRH